MSWVYIMASKPCGTLYIGLTADLRRRVGEHRSLRGCAFTRKHRVQLLVWFEEIRDASAAAQRERTMKEWPRAWKINLVERSNPDWLDLWPSIAGLEDARPRGRAPGLRFGKVENPQEAFIAALKMNEN